MDGDVTFHTPSALATALIREVRQLELHNLHIPHPPTLQLPHTHARTSKHLHPLSAASQGRRSVANQAGPGGQEGQGLRPTRLRLCSPQFRPPFSFSSPDDFDCQSKAVVMCCLEGVVEYIGAVMRFAPKDGGMIVGPVCAFEQLHACPRPCSLALPPEACTGAPKSERGRSRHGGGWSRRRCCQQASLCWSRFLGPAQFSSPLPHIQTCTLFLLQQSALSAPLDSAPAFKLTFQPEFKV